MQVIHLHLMKRLMKINMKEKEKVLKRYLVCYRDQGKEFNDLWEEFEACETIEAQYGAMLDRMQPLLQNYINQGGSWTEHNITVEQIYKRNEITLKKGPKELQDIVNFVVDECVKNGYVKDNK